MILEVTLYLAILIPIILLLKYLSRKIKVNHGKENDNTMSTEKEVNDETVITNNDADSPPEWVIDIYPFAALILCMFGGCGVSGGILSVIYPHDCGVGGILIVWPASLLSGIIGFYITAVYVWGIRKNK